MLGLLLRRWWRSPLLTAQFALTVAVGMGAITALASALLALGYQPLPFRDPGRLVAIWERSEARTSVLAISGPDMMDLSAGTHGVFVSLGAFSPPHSLWLLDHKGATEILGCSIQASVLSDLGIRPALGRNVRPDDEPLGRGAAPAWISYGLWQTRYGRGKSVIGTEIGIATDATGLNRLAGQVVGVLPSGVSIPLPFAEKSTDVWYIAPANLSDRDRRSTVYFGLGRLRPGATTSQAQAALAVVAKQLGHRYRFDSHRVPVVQSLEAIAHGPARQTMGLLVLGVALVFLVGFVNVAILMGAEGRKRRREIAIRASLGAGRWELWRDIAAEKCFLTLLSLVLGIAFASALLRVLTRLLPAAGLGPALVHTPPLNLAVMVGFSTFAFVAALVWSVTLVTAAGRSGSLSTLAGAGGGPGYTGVSDAKPGARRWSSILLAAQAGTGICLLAAATLTARTYVALSTANLGPAPRHTILLSVDARDNVNGLTEAQTAAFNEGLLSRLSRLPGTEAMAMADHFPPSSYPVSFLKQGDADDTSREATQPISITPGYFRTLGIPILFGRGFDDSDNSGAEPVAIISLDMAKENWDLSQQAVGSEISLGSKFRYKVVGVAADFTGYWSQKPVPTIYLPQAQAGYCCSAVILRTTSSATSVAALAPQALTGVPVPTVISSISTMQARWQATLTRPLARTAGMLLLALLGLGLSAQGVYAVAAAAVSSRVHELAVRSVLGASPGRLAWDVTRELVFAVVAGAGLGTVASLELLPLLKQWLGTSAVWHAEPISVAVLLLVLAAAVGAYFPARTALRANPADVLRQG